MLRLHIRHRTTYTYAEAVRFGQHRLVLRPREGHDLHIIDMQLLIEPAHEITWVRDVYGNSIALVDFSAAAKRLEIVSSVTLERIDPFPEKHFHEPWRVSWPVPYAGEEQPVVDAYRELSFPEEAAELKSWVDEVLPRNPDDAEGMLRELCDRVHAAVTYRRRAEKGVQTPLQTLRAGSGSCRDLATLLMDAARVLGVASRFASGYLHGPASLWGHASTHAWTECYLPALGWRGLDPTVGKAIGLQHIATGVSQHPRGVMPVTGSFHGTRSAFLGMDVEVLTRDLADPALRVSNEATRGQ
jgi:transglutaminase-like putative cysteine protease